MEKSRQGRQDAKLLTETNDVVDMKLDAEIGYAASPDLEAWILNKSQQAINLETGRFVQLISERDCKPIDVFRNIESTIETNIKIIAHESQNRERTVVDEEGEIKDSRLLWLLIIASLVLLAFLVVIWRLVA